MRNRLSVGVLLAAALLLLTVVPLLADEADYFFDDSRVHEVHLYFDDPDWYNTLYDSHDSDPDDPYHPGRFECDGVTLDPVGIRFKGNSSFRINSEKKSIKIDFDEYDEDNPDKRFYGLAKLNLNNGYKDPTFLREKIFLDFAGEHVPTIRAVHVRVYINDEYWGLYTAVEQVDKTFVQDRFGSNEDGNLWKAQAEEDGAPNDDFGSDLTYLGADPAPYHDYYVLKTNETEDDYSQLIEFIDVLNNTAAANLPDAIEPIHDVRVSLMGLALNNLFVNLDSYTGSAHNYYLYDRDDSGRITHIHWDANEAFGRFQMFMAPWDNALTLDPFWTPFPNPGQEPPERPLMEKLWAVDSYKEYYENFMAWCLEEGFDLTTMSARIHELADLIRTDVYNDTKKQYTNSQFETNLTSDIQDGPETIYGLEHFVEARAAYLASVLPTLDPTVTLYINEIVADNKSTVSDEAGDFDDWVEIYNPGTTDVDLAGYWFSDGDMPLYQIPDGYPAETTVSAGGYVLVWFDGEPGEGPLHVDMKLQEAGESVLLYAPDAVQIIDSYEFPELFDDVSAIRFPDGTDDWYRTVTPTPLANNYLDEAYPGCTDPLANNYDPSANVDDDSCEYPPSPEGVYINEFVAKYVLLSGPSGTSDWLELYNAESEAVDISGWTLTDSPGDAAATYTFPSDTILESGGFLVVICDDSSYFDGEYHHAPFKLGGSDEVLLEDAIGQQVDYIKYNTGEGIADGMTFDYPEDNEDRAWGRLVDGGADWGEIKPATPGEPNVSLSVEDVVATAYNTVVDVTWSCRNADATGFNVYGSDSESGQFDLLTSAPVASAPYRETALTNGATRYYYVVAVNESSEEGLASDIVSATPSASTGVTPVTDLKLEVSGSDIVLRWTAVTSEPAVDAYRIYRDGLPLKDTDVDNGLFLLEEIAAASEYSDLGEATTPDTWFYEVRVVDTAGDQSED